MTELRRNYAHDPRSTTVNAVGAVVLKPSSNRWYGSTATTTPAGTTSAVAVASDGPLPTVTSYTRKRWTVAPDAIARCGDTGIHYGLSGAFLPVTAGQTWTFSAYMRASRRARLNMDLYVYSNSTGTYVTPTGWSSVRAANQPGVAGGRLVTTDNTWVRVWITLTIPAGVTHLSVVADRTNSATDGAVKWENGDTLDTTAVLAEPVATLGEYIDGSFTERELSTFRWLGAPNASASVQEDAPVRWLSPVSSPLTTHRVEGWRVDLLTSRDAVLGPLAGVSGGYVENNGNAVIRGGGEIQVRDLSQNIDWLSNRVKLWWVANGQSWPLGVYLLSAPTASFSETGRSWSVELLDKLAVLDQDCLDGSYSIAAGAVVTDAVRLVIESAGETASSVTPSSEMATVGMVWEAGTSKLRVINDMLASINYFSLYADGHGRYRAEPYVRPQDRATTWSFETGAASVHMPDFLRDEDLSSVPNKVVLVSAASGEAPALTSVATNTDPSSRFSYSSRGRWIVYTETGVEVTSQIALDGMAARRLIDLTGASATIELDCAVLPLEPNNAVGFRSNGLDVRGVVQRTTLRLEVGALMRVDVLEVAR